jgi:thioredoxin-like negative regulator of GroEL
MKPSWARIANSYPDLSLTRVNVDREQDAARRAGIDSIPQAVILSNGNEVGRISGHRDFNGIVYELVKIKEGSP